MKNWLIKFMSGLVAEEPVSEVEIREVEESLEDQKLIQEMEEAAAESFTSKNGLISTAEEPELPSVVLKQETDDPVNPEDLIDVFDIEDPVEPEFKEFHELIEQIRYYNKAENVTISISTKQSKGETRKYVSFLFDGDPINGKDYLTVTFSGNTLMFDGVDDKLNNLWCFKLERRKGKCRFITSNHIMVECLNDFVHTDSEDYFVPTTFEMMDYGFLSVDLKRGESR